ncbi:MAG: HAD hydrolase-like protein, partial [Propionibacteriaceae bacterium]|nr:HAD hydrolase-like protein [Propionibacteriaceae bacterium]
IKVALTTGFSPETRDELLDALQWRSLVDLALSPSDVGRGRPYPDLALGALLKLGGTRVSRLVTVGDTVADVESGLAAGAGLVVGVTSGAHSHSALRAAGAHVVLASIAELPNLLGVKPTPSDR